MTDWCCVCVCVYVFVFSKTASPFISKSLSLARHAGVSEVLQGLLRCLGGGITRGDAVGYPGGPWWFGGGITQGDVLIALTF